MNTSLENKHLNAQLWQFQDYLLCLPVYHAVLAPKVLYNGLSLSNSFKQQRKLTTFKAWQKREHKK